MTDRLDKKAILAAYDKRFGPRGWRSEIARALDLDVQLITRGRPPTLRLLWAVYEWLEATPEIVWPDRYAGMRDLSEKVRGGAEG